MKATTGVLPIVVAVACMTAGCHGVGWSELGSDSKPRPQNPPAAQDQESQPARESRDNQPAVESRDSQPPAQSKDKEELQVVPRNSREVARKLSADDIVRIMQRVGFSDQQILDLGPELYKALRQSGAAEVRSSNGVEMIFVVKSQQVQINCRARGMFFYDLTKSRFVIGATREDRGR